MYLSLVSPVISRVMLDKVTAMGPLESIFALMLQSWCLRMQAYLVAVTRGSLEQRNNVARWYTYQKGRAYRNAHRNTMLYIHPEGTLVG